MLRYGLSASAAALALGVVTAAPAHALTMKECSAKYQTAKQGGTLKGQTWNAYRKAECGGDEDASDAEAAAAIGDDPKDAAAGPAPSASTDTKKAAISGKAVFPTAVAAKYAGETPGRARMHTCVDQYKANKSGGGNGDLKWIQKGGGYYSQCNAKLKT